MDLRRGAIWGVVLTLIAGGLTAAYLGSITIDDGLEALAFIPICALLFTVAGAAGGRRGRTYLWGIGLGLGSGALLLVAEAAWLVVLIRTRTSSPVEEPLGFGTGSIALVAAAGVSTIGSTVGMVLVLGLLGWLPTFWLRERRLRRFPPPPADAPPDRGPTPG